MEIEDYMSKLQQDLDASLAKLDKDLQGFGINASQEDKGVMFCPECGSRIEFGSRFCPNCGTKLEEESKDLKNEQSSLPVHIIFTDTTILASKYGCSKDTVYSLLNSFVSSTEQFDDYWQIVDAADYQEKKSWQSYNDILSKKLKGEGVGMRNSVFIIGGDDVIPIPKAKNPLGGSNNDVIPCDMCYCFDGDFFKDLTSGNHGDIEYNEVRNVVSRLPLENGKMKETIQKDLGAYFDRCIQYLDTAPKADKVMMMSNSSWIPASKTMSEHLPLINHASSSDMVCHDMYICPPVSPMVKDVYQTLKVSDLLLFNLHGSDHPTCSGFYSDEAEAFSIDMLKKSKARILNTVACFGARYNGYDRDESMLLSALYKNSFVSYCGALIPVPMTRLHVPSGIDVSEGSGSEHLMPIYCMEQYSGFYGFAEALMIAKIKYFSIFRHFEGDDFSLATIMMFSLYGYPLLRIPRNEIVIENARRANVIPGTSKSYSSKSICLRKSMRVLSRDAKSTGLLADIQNAIDSNLSAIHEIVQSRLYDELGLESQWLDHVDAYVDENGKGYTYAYCNSSKAYGNRYWVDVDMSGNIKRTITCK